ncbi:MAG: radical SAM protein [Spirochaetota bacterium]|nr:radical SAM protein [Spirochaetota bacterium]
MTEQKIVMDVIHETSSLCQVCKNAVKAKVIATEDNRAIMQKECPSHGNQEVVLSNNAGWYRENRRMSTAMTPPKSIHNAVELGCPFDCGPCGNHMQKVKLPVVTITSACNLDCPVCYVYNKNTGAYYMEKSELKDILDHLEPDEKNELDVINFTGGDPTLHPEMLDFIEISKGHGIHRVSICSNGIRLAEDESMVRRLAELDGRVALSFDSFEDEVMEKMSGASLQAIKMKCLDLLEKHSVDTTLITVMYNGRNDREIADILRLALAKNNIRHLEIHTMTYTGQGGASQDRSGRITIYEVIERLEETSNGLLTVNDFVPLPCAHPLCYQVCYILVNPDDGNAIPFSRFLDSQTMRRCLGEKLYLEPSSELEHAVRTAIDDLWIRDDEDSDYIISALKELLSAVYPAGKAISQKEQLAASERRVKAVYIHSHMDEENFDTERLYQCCDSNCYPDGRTIPVCAYNVLYRETENRFMENPKSPGERTGGQMTFPAFP